MTSPKKTRILHLIKSLGRGGAEKLIPETAALHDKEEYSFYCLYFHHRPNSLIDELEEVGVKVSYFPSSNLALPLQVGKVVEFVKKNQIDIIHCHLPWAGVLGRWVGQKTGAKVVYTEHNMWERYHPLSRRLNKLTFGWQQGVIAVSGEVRNSILRHYKPTVNSPEIKTIPNAVNTEKFQKDLIGKGSIREKFGIPNDAPVIGQVAVLRSQKRLDHWIAVAKEIAQSHPSVHFLLVGDGPERELVESTIGTGDFASKIHLAGAQEAVIPYLSAMDVYMMTSEFEGLPVAMLEAMSCGLPVLSTEVGGIREVITDGVEGMLCPKDHTENLVFAASTLLTDPLRCQEMAKRARQRVISHFSMKRMVRDLEEFYQEVQKLS
ncbi:glycosyl transferase [Echinicola strongylocentroti]|uniref:Glycosyl transferase n=1 Tax=Echinicola strongylocentroti TaxID=1795355 RepID=A0A2Z4INA2_9BACT|nr:glycosyltransferase [Echinicola strongylocentroti]AWW32066.1 glycosyl transferase [Echinicola strongylocentroti]